MARVRNKNSKSSFNGLGLTGDEDKALKKLLKEKDLSCQQLVRVLIRAWLAEIE